MFFEQAEITRLNSTDMKTYQESLKSYRDNKNPMDYAIATARQITKITGLPKEDNEAL